MENEGIKNVSKTFPVNKLKNEAGSKLSFFFFL